MKHIVEYVLPYEHIVQVGIDTDNRDAALRTAQAYR